MLDSVIEMVKFVGALGGLASSAFLIYDRLFRNRPGAFLIPADYKANLRLKNISEETIIIDQVSINPPILRVTKANDLLTSNDEKAAALYPTMGDKKPEVIFIVIKPMEERTFALNRLADFENADGNKVISIRCRWRNTRKPFPVGRYVSVKTTVKDVTDLREASLAGKA